MTDNSTIAAISTAPGMGAIAVIRLSGNEALAICDRVFEAASGKKLSDQQANTLHFGKIKDGEQVIDEVVTAIFKAPHSYTGEDVAEISCHGAIYIQQQILMLLIRNGARQALPGEFTQRAFLNGKMDLSQAEAVGDLIAASSAAGHRVALQQMRGGFSAEIAKLRDKLLSFISLIELELDFSEEDVEFANREELQRLISSIEHLLTRLVESFRTGNAIKNGIPVAIAGKTNVGKSTLLNALINEERAIVSDIHGTTRDVIEDVIHIDGLEYRFIDTAGIRETLDTIETMGITRTFEKIRQARIVLLITEATEEPASIAKQVEALKLTEDQHLILVVNKTDMRDDPDFMEAFTAALPVELNEVVFISAKNRENLEELTAKLSARSGLTAEDADATLVTNVRHYEALSRALEAVHRAGEGLVMQLPTDLLAQDIRETLHHLGEITGQVTTDEVLGNIFKNFCIGK